jgi:predicted Abi (CAAX) family protease
MGVASAALHRLSRCLRAFPDAAGWRCSAVIAAVALGAIGGIGFGGLLHLSGPGFAGLPLRMLTVFFAPALFEEAVFRGLLTPDRSEAPRPGLWIGIVTLAFTAWHAIEILFLRHAAPIFLRPDFLLCAAILGGACSVIRWRTGSLWPCVALHWAAVVVWQTWFDGPGLAALR